ncbi:MAG: hypothetical protein NZL93_02375, partial [Chthoniobacterales bacterium]|nr:hypothetical protein [Chthoniobacterales bacterium]
MLRLPIQLGFPFRIWAIAQATLTELARMKAFAFLLIFSLIVIGNSAFLARLSFAEEFQMLKDISLGAMSVFSAMLAIFGTASLIPKDIEDRTTYTILSKPVHRYEYLFGKLMGIFLLLAISILIMFVLFAAVLFYRQQAVISQTIAELGSASSGELEDALKQIQSAAFNKDLVLATIIIFFKSAVIAAVTLLISSFSTSAIYGMITSTAVY